MGKQRTYAGAYSDNDFNDNGKDKIRNAGAGPYASYPGRKPNQYVNDDGKSPIQLDTDRVTKSGDDNQNLTEMRRRGGFSGPVK